MHRYILEPYHGRGSRFACPQCHHKQRFKRYIDTETQTYLADHVGKCDRIDRCGYHYPPRDFFASGGVSHTPAMNYEPLSINRFDELPLRLVEETVKTYDRNNFVAFLSRCFGKDVAYEAAYRYNVGTSKHWPGATIFWQMDVKYNIRTGKIMLYNAADGHRVKHPNSHIAWAHSVMGNTNFNLSQCFFGEHLLNTNPYKQVAVCESEKTAVMGSVCRPEYIWLAAGSLEGLSLGKCLVLKDRRVILFPDVNGYDKWKLKARELNLRMPTTNFTVDKTLEITSTPEERAQGIDLADCWIEHIKQTNLWTENLPASAEPITGSNAC